MKQNYEGKYQKMAEEFHRKGLDEVTIKKFIREEQQNDEFTTKAGIADLEATKEFNALPKDERELLLSNAWCSTCRGVTTFAKGYIVRKDKYGLVLEGSCIKCRKPVVRCLY